MKGKKLLFLFLALLFPIVIFVFLKLFGSNEFQVPVFHLEGQIVVPESCDTSYRAPYSLGETVMAGLGMNKGDSLYVLYFEPSGGSAVERVVYEFRDDPVQVLAEAESGWRDATYVRRCVLLMDAGSSIALVDHLGRIRGYYRGDDRDEVDRLIVEMKIILKQY